MYTTREWPVLMMSLHILLHFLVVPSQQMEYRKEPYDLFELFVNLDRGGFTEAIMLEGSLIQAAREGEGMVDVDCDDHVELFLYGYKQYLQSCQCLRLKILHRMSSERHNHTEVIFNLRNDINRMIIQRSYLAIPHSSNQLVCEIPSGPEPISCSNQDVLVARRGLLLATGQPLRRMLSRCPTYSLFRFESMASKVRNGLLTIRMKCSSETESCESAWQHQTYLAFLQLSKGCLHSGCQSNTLSP